MTRIRTGRLSALSGCLVLLLGASAQAASSEAVDPDVSFASAVSTTVEGPGSVSVAITLSQTAAATVTIPYTIGGSADAGDATVPAGPLVIPVGQAGGTIDIQTLDDVLQEGLERITLTLGNPTGGQLGAITVHELVIMDDEPAATISFDLAADTAAEGDGVVSVALTLSAARTEDAEVTFTEGGSATPGGVDLTTTPPSPIVIPGGATTATLSVTLVQDALDELDEDLTLTLSAPANAVLGATTQYVLTITDDDDPPTVAFQLAESAATESAGTVGIGVELSAPSSFDVTIPITTAGTAEDGIDYTWSPASLVIPAGDTVGLIDVTPTDDASVESSETAIFQLGAPTNATLGSPVDHTLTIIDDDGAPQSLRFTVAQTSVDEDAGTVGVLVALSDYAAQPVTVPVSASGTADPGVDYNLLTNPLTIPVGSLTGSIDVQIIDDMDPESPEIVSLTLGMPTGAVLGGTSQHDITIEDNDSPLVVDFVVATSVAGEGIGTALVDVTLSSPAPADVTIPILVSGSATSADATVTPDPLVIPMGSSAGQLAVAIVGDSLHEDDETVVIEFGTITGADPGTTVLHTLTIQDDDPEPAVGFTMYRTVVAEASGAFLVRMELDAVSGLDVTVPFTVDGEAAGPGDATLPPSPATIPAGSAFVDLPVTLVVDRIPEPGERIRFHIGAPTGATVGAISSLVVAIEDGNAGPLATAPPLTPSTTQLDFPTLRVGEVSPSQSVFFSNMHTAPVTLTEVKMRGAMKGEFFLSYPVALPITLQPGQSAQVDVIFQPLTRGPRVVTIESRQQQQGVAPPRIELKGICYGETGAEIAMTASNVLFEAPGRAVWSAEYGATGGSLSKSSSPVQGTSMPGLYQTFRLGSQFDYALELPNGAYEVIVHTWEPSATGPGQRLIDVFVEGALAIDDLDVFAAVGGETAYVSEPYEVTLTDGVLDLQFQGVTTQALISAIEVRSIPIVSTSTSSLAFGTVDQGTSAMLDVVFQNDGLHSAVIDLLRFRVGAIGNGLDFAVMHGGSLYQGSTATVIRLPEIELPPGTTYLPVMFTPTVHADHQITIDFEITERSQVFSVDVTGTGGAEAGWGFLHPVLDNDPLFVVDYDGDGFETVALLGGESHTHEPGHSLVGYEWLVNGAPVATTIDTTHTFPTGSSTATLTITDDNVPADTASDDRTISVYPVDQIPGPLALFYDGSVAGEVFLLDNVPALYDFASRLPNQLSVDAQDGRVGASPFTGSVMVRWLAAFDLAGPRTLEFVATGGVDRRVLVNGVLVSGPQALGAGPHELELRFAVSNLVDLPVSLMIMEAGSAAIDVMDALVHSEQSLPPVIHTMPTSGTDLGGNRIDITGFGFFPESQTVVHWGATDITSSQFDEWNGEAITLTTPPGMGTISVTVETPQGISDPVSFHYSPTGPIPLRFTLLTGLQASVPGVTNGTWGPDGKLYVSSLNGSIRVITYGDDWSVTSMDFHPGVSGLTNRDTLGMVFNPFDPYDPQDPTSLKLYIAHGEQFQNGGGAYSGPSYFTGQISLLTGPDFDNPQPIVTQLPVSNHDHSINGMVFDDNGDLIVCCGGNTNAGVQHPQIGDVPESPLSGAILRVRLSDPSFNGTIVYEDTSTGIPVDDQTYGGQVDVAAGVDVEVYAPGLRNPFDLILHTNGYIYATDNGPNSGYGPASLSATTDEGPVHPYEQDEIILVEPGNYYGAANRNRGRYDDRQNVYRRPQTASVANLFTKPLAIVDSSTNGMDEYRATAFNSGMRGNLIAMKWNFGLWRLELSPGGRGIASSTIYQNNGNTNFPPNRALDVVTGPGGAIIGIDYIGGKVRVQVPDDVAAVGPTPYDISPWRTLPQGGQPFVIGGVNFGTNPGVVSVTVGGVPATVTSVSSTRIRGIFPPSPTGGATGMLPVSVTVGATQVSITGAMQFLPVAPGLKLGDWRPGSVLPLALGEVSVIELDGRLFVIGQGDSRTFAYNPLQNNWTYGSLAQRPFPGNHHGVEVYDGKLYVLGGLDSGSAGRVQIYDPVANSWSLGAPMPWNGGSCATALIDGKMYVCGGNLQGAGTAGNLAVYDPVLDTWTSLGVMPTPVNHAASGTDGERLFVFGGRQGPNVPSAGFDDVQVYDPVTDSWQTSDAGQVAAMPLGRGGTGHAVFHAGEFYVMGGEDASNTFAEVQVYDPATNMWRMDTPMPTARHGIFPALFQSRIFVFGGGLFSGFGFSSVSEVLSPR